MTDTDLPEFLAIFQDMRMLFALRANPSELEHITAAYFRVLRRYPVQAVLLGAMAWTETGRHFPKPAEWLQAIPKAEAARLLPMPEVEAREYLRAKALGWQDDPCACYDCRDAEVTHRFLRYVPDVDSDGRDLRMQLGDGVVVAGHWAHGQELKGYYAAREAFEALKERHPPKRMTSHRKPLAKVLIEQAEKRCAELEAHPPVEDADFSAAVSGMGTVGTHEARTSDD